MNWRKRFAPLILCLLVPLVMPAGEEGQQPSRDLIAALQKGGFVLYVRHARTEPDQADTDPLHLENTKAQRQLSEEGRNQAMEIGKTFRSLKIPVDKVIVSRFHRAYETAQLLDIGMVVTSLDVTEGGLVVSPRENQRRAAALKSLLSTSPPSKTNIVIVSHRPNLQEAAGKEFGDLAEGEIVVFQPLGNNGYKVLARVPSLSHLTSRSE